MDIWDKLYAIAAKEYHPEEISPFIYAHHVVCAIESYKGEIFTGFCIESCCGVMDLCAERVAALNMYLQSRETRIQRLLVFRDKTPYGKGSGMPCGAYREFLLQLNKDNAEMEIMIDFSKRQTIKLKELMLDWWGQERYQ